MKYIAPFALVLLLGATPAQADMPNDPCQGKSAGDACVTVGGDDGACLQMSGTNFLTCEAGASPTTSAGGGGTEGGDDGDEDEGGCSVGGEAGPGAIGWIALALLAARRRR